MSIPKVFISYSHDTLEHKKWILELATRMRNNGIDATIDQWELKPGDDLPHFMETHLASADKVIMVCTENYVAKANSGTGGVGYEKMIITSNLLSRMDENKIIPIIRQVSTKDTPTFLKTKLFIDFSKDDQHEFSFDELIRTIHGSPLYKKPEIGNNPFKQDDNISSQKNNDVVIKLMTIICEQYNIYCDDIPIEEIESRINVSRITLEIWLSELEELGYILTLRTLQGQEFIRLEKKGKQYAINNNIVQ